MILYIAEKPSLGRALAQRWEHQGVDVVGGQAVDGVGVEGVGDATAARGQSRGGSLIHLDQVFMHIACCSQRDGVARGLDPAAPSAMQERLECLLRHVCQEFGTEQCAGWAIPDTMKFGLDRTAAPWARGAQRWNQKGNPSRSPRASAQ